MCMLKWKELLDLHHNPPLIPPTRTPEVDEMYRIHRERTPNLVKDLIRNLFKDDGHFVLVPCPFPYDLEEGIAHWVLWINDDYEYMPWMIDVIIKELCHDFKIRPGIDMVCYQNFKHNMTIPQIQHYQVFFRIS